MICPHVAGSHSSGTVDLVTIEMVLVEFLSAYAGRGAYLRQAALKIAQAIRRLWRVASSLALATEVGLLIWKS
jgi:hypothetical protein